jgi:mono/diheme cytochrome c family protein
MAISSGVIARRPQAAEAISAPHPRARDCFAALAMTAMLVLTALPVRAAEGDADLGRETYQDLCATCHGRDMVNTGTLSFDLRKFPKDAFDRFRISVLNGKGNGMPPWAGKLGDDDLANLWAYVKSGG